MNGSSAWECAGGADTTCRLRTQATRGRCGRRPTLSHASGRACRVPGRMLRQGRIDMKKLTFIEILSLFAIGGILTSIGLPLYSD